MKNYLEHTLLILKNIYDHQDSHQACKDNALAAICKSIIVFNPPMPYELFVNNLIQSMPFKGKFITKVRRRRGRRSSLEMPDTLDPSKPGFDPTTRRQPDLHYRKRSQISEEVQIGRRNLHFGFKLSACSQRSMIIYSNYVVTILVRFNKIIMCGLISGWVYILNNTTILLK